MTTETIEAPRSARTAQRSTNWEKWGWIYMRASGLVLVVLIFGHLFINLLAGEGGVKAIDFAFVAGKWADPFWQVYDTLLLWLALIHGSNGMRTIVNDYVGRPTTRKVFLGALVVSSGVLLLLGSLVIWTFDPCPAGAPADLLPSICSR
ncbi:succinate dehydrogenase [Frigoribacterium sp. Leaf164]|uniref:succinate dehydrogenase hydrophobic membrane anchor subunit n=1 Tax=Frigoribacterium sp. Leaf164 TaxID=1736282 RepID=UPI0006FEC893|nr:succinate dehydrogenase hydrophobic membrane anchor subunit [Frigoribacterium sp. Leaf164]KQR46480.1 succinate dehydrogenase [Frigoribacterium sp. Leaf164]